MNEPCHPIRHDPIDRLIHVHAKSLKHALRDQPCDHRAPACREADAGQCRIIINAARREIDRLRRQLGTEDCLHLVVRHDALQSNDHTANAGSDSSRAIGRKVYALETPQVHAEMESSPSPIIFAAMYLRVTNLGTLLDVLG